MVDENGIQPGHVYNVDETGFAMGLIATAKVVTRAEYYGWRAVLQPGNREWVTIIESISADGHALPPTVVFKGKNISHHGSITSQITGDSRSLKVAGLRMKLSYGGFRINSYQRPRAVRRENIPI